jgi:hypothetical protein
MSDPTWEKYLRELAAYQDQLDRIERIGGAYGPISRPRPPSPPPPDGLSTPETRRPGRPTGSGIRKLASREAFIQAYWKYEAEISRPPTRAEFAEREQLSEATIKRRLDAYQLRWPPHR